MKDLTVIEAQLTRVLNFFPRVDTKVAGLFTVNSAVLTVSALNVQAGDLKQWYIAIPAVFLVLGLVGSYTFLYRCNFPDLEGGQGSLIYFAAIQDRTERTSSKRLARRTIALTCLAKSGAIPTFCARNTGPLLSQSVLRWRPSCLLRSFW